jgi:hypothetical protein
MSETTADIPDRSVEESSRIADSRTPRGGDCDEPHMASPRRAGKFKISFK